MLPSGLLTCRYKKTKGNGFNEDNTAYGARNGVHITGVGDAKEHSRDAVYTASRQPAPPTQPPMHAQPGAQL